MKQKEPADVVEHLPLHLSASVRFCWAMDDTNIYTLQLPFYHGHGGLSLCMPAPFLFQNGSTRV